MIFVAESWPGLDDDRALAEAVRQQAILITSDNGFGEMVYRQQRVSRGVLLLRLAGLSNEERAARVADAVLQHGAEMAGAFSVLDATGLRVRRTP